MTPRLSRAHLDPAEALDAAAGAGRAVCVFAGTVRAENRGRTVASLTYEAHGPLGERVLAELEEEAEAEDGIRRCRIAHRVGTLEVGEVSVVVTVAADDADAAAEAAGRAMDQLKERLPVWKRERYADGESRWLDGSPLRPGGGEERGAGPEAGPGKGPASAEADADDTAGAGPGADDEPNGGAS